MFMMHANARAIKYFAAFACLVEKITPDELLL